MALRPKINVVRAVTATVARRALFLASVMMAIAMVLLLIIIGLLAYFFSNWWWLLLILYVPLVLIGLLLLLIARFIVRRLYKQPIAPEQQLLLNDFTDKIQRLLETRGIGWPVFALMNVRDLLLYRELRTVKALVTDTSSLKRDFERLEKEL